MEKIFFLYIWMNNRMDRVKSGKNINSEKGIKNFVKKWKKMLTRVGASDIIVKSVEK